jgi:hypothetical protein
MNDKPAQIVDLFTAFNEDMKQRSVGNVPAPRADAELVEKLATSEEREATLKLLRKFVDIHPVTIGGIIRIIELGRHRGR